MLHASHNAIQPRLVFFFKTAHSSLYNGVTLSTCSLELTQTSCGFALHTVLYICCSQTMQHLSLSIQWLQILLPTCRWVVLATSKTSWRSAGPAPLSSKTSCFRPNIRSATDWRTALNGRWCMHWNTQRPAPNTRLYPGFIVNAESFEKKWF